MAIYKQINTEEEKRNQSQANQQTPVQDTMQTPQPVQQTQQTSTPAQPAVQNLQPTQTQQYQAPQTSGNVAAAQQLLDQLSAQKPGTYQSQWSEKLNGILDKITNRQPFQYDVNADALYQMYKDQYVQQGKMAMQDTMGQAATMTGGYGNSYAQGVGQQAYQGYLQQLTGKIPELAQMAQDQYNQEGQDLYNLYTLMGNRENQDYSRYRDDMGQWNTDMDRLYNQYLDERNFQYQQEKNNQSLAQAQVDYLLSLGVKPNAELMRTAGYDSQYANEAIIRAQAAQNAGRSSGYSGGGGNESGGYQWSGEGEPTLEEMLLDMAAQNRPNEELKKVILAASADGIIDRDDEQAWAKSFGVIGANPTYKAPNTRSKFDEALKAEAEKTATQKARGQGAPSLEEMWIWW